MFQSKSNMNFVLYENHMKNSKYGLREIYMILVKMATKC